MISMLHFTFFFLIKTAEKYNHNNNIEYYTVPEFAMVEYIKWHLYLGHEGLFLFYSRLKALFDLMWKLNLSAWQIYDKSKKKILIQSLIDRCTFSNSKTLHIRLHDRACLFSKRYPLPDIYDIFYQLFTYNLMNAILWTTLMTIKFIRNFQP